MSVRARGEAPARAEADSESAELVRRPVAVTFTVDSAAHARALQEDGVRIAGGGERQYWGGTLLFVVDPAGNTLTLVEPVPT